MCALRALDALYVPRVLLSLYVTGGHPNEARRVERLRGVAFEDLTEHQRIQNLSAKGALILGGSKDDDLKEGLARLPADRCK